MPQKKITRSRALTPVFFFQAIGAVAGMEDIAQKMQVPNKMHQNLVVSFTKKIPSLKLTYPRKINPWKSRFLLETIIFRGYVSFRECKTFRVLMDKIQ